VLFGRMTVMTVSSHTTSGLPSFIRAPTLPFSF
jgi:hypothetical protein